MYRKWVTNADRSQARELRNGMETKSGRVCLIGRPSASDQWSVEELETMNMVGIYMEVPYDEVKPDPNCPECRGTGTVTLFTSSAPCKCLQRFVSPEQSEHCFDEDYDTYWE